MNFKGKYIVATTAIEQILSFCFFGVFHVQNVSVFVEETQPDDQQCLGQIVWYQLLTSLDLNTQGEPRNCGNNGHWELTPTLAQIQSCNYCN